VPWLYRAQLAWGALHCALTAVLYLALWAAEKPLRLLVTAGLIWLVFWVIL
jgi:hypothetical protein